MANVAIPLAATAFTVAGKVTQGRAADKAAKDEARQMEANAARRLRQGKAEAEEELRRTARLMSDARAIQGSSGFSASDAQALQQLGEIAGAGRYNELSYLYEAELDAESLRRGAEATRRRGKYAKRAAYLGAASTALSGIDRVGGFDTFKRSQSGTSFGPYRSGYRPNPGFPGYSAPYNPFNVGTFR